MRGVWIVFVASLFVGCQSGQDQTNTGTDISEMTPNERRELLIEQNRGRVRQENEQVSAYIDSSEISFTPTGTGLRYAIIEQGVEEAIQETEIVSMRYNLTLLDGTHVGSSKEDGALTIRVNKDNNGVLGLHEAMLNLHRGDSAVVIIPSHLAWGIAGNSDGVPPMSTVIYYLRVQD